MLVDIMRNVHIPTGQLDHFISRYCASGYTAKKAYIFLDDSNPCLDDNYCKLIWNQYVPPKVNVLIWRLLLNHLPSKENLILRGVDDLSNTNCVFCSAQTEDVNHLFTKCRKVQLLWSKICLWWGFSFVPPDNASLLILQLCSLPDSKKARNCWIPIVLATAWLIWYSRNRVIFKSMTWDENNLADLVQSKTFEWIKGISTSAAFSFGDWCQFPMLCSKET
ncbi:hypothetical protein SLEP1_g20513 [Rubroshorea leprosula]|uniref:Reverse transcriptase zinc-binding domain-containing protein n=1 Tax=Rubroshorea leprosula TaxID=152421 RepID=A0AAV5J2Z8_9ROSI|nr:hypothetical protein SLEP1_g20513 [Rubroshorea leprosula]